MKLRVDKDLESFLSLSFDFFYLPPPCLETKRKQFMKVQFYTRCFVWISVSRSEVRVQASLLLIEGVRERNNEQNC
jgi:hypothetical protein